jgi:plastocyanin
MTVDEGGTMTRRIAPALGLFAILVAACSGGGATTAPSEAPATAAAPSAAASEAAPSEAAPSEAGGGVCAATTDAGTVEVTVQGRAFGPGKVTAKVGDVIVWTNKDSVPHTATLDDDSCTTGSLGKDASGALVFSAPGTYPYHCRIHPDMTGTIEIS